MNALFDQCFLFLSSLSLSWRKLIYLSIKWFKINSKYSIVTPIPIPPKKNRHTLKTKKKPKNKLNIKKCFVSLSWIMFDILVAKGQSQIDTSLYDDLQIQSIAKLRWRIWGDCSPLETRVVLWSLDQSMNSLMTQGVFLYHITSTSKLKYPQN